MKKNPFKVIEKIATVIVLGLTFAILAFYFVGLPIIGLVTHQFELVWWPYAFVVGYLVMLVAFLLIGAGWRKAKAKWEMKHND